MSMKLLVKAPELLKKRLNTREENSDQKLVILLSSLLFLAVFVLSGLDHRFGWSTLPSWVAVAASVVFLAGYGLVRHPMYLSTVLLFLAMPLVLGSLYAFALILSATRPSSRGAYGTRSAPSPRASRGTGNISKGSVIA